MTHLLKSLPDFQRIFPNDEACIAYLFASHFPHGFICPTCGDTQEPYRFAARPTTRRCRANQRHEVSLTANTVMHRTKVPICTWFYAAFLVTSLTPGMSALQLRNRICMAESGSTQAAERHEHARAGS